MGNVYSTRFFCEVTSSGTAVVYNVPTSMVAIVRDIEVVTDVDTAEAQGFIDGVQFLSSGPIAVPAGATEMYSWRGRQVVNADENLEFVTAGACSLVVSGYLLSA